jgi:hypothetical protein
VRRDDSRHQFDPADQAAVADAEVCFQQLACAGFAAAKRRFKPLR